MGRPISHSLDIKELGKSRRDMSGEWEKVAGTECQKVAQEGRVWYCGPNIQFKVSTRTSQTWSILYKAAYTNFWKLNVPSLIKTLLQGWYVAYKWSLLLGCLHSTRGCLVQVLTTPLGSSSCSCASWNAAGVGSSNWVLVTWEICTEFWDLASM